MATATEDPLLEQTAEDADDEQLEPNAEKGELFNRDQYEREDLAIPKVDGQQIDKIRVDFGGSIMLDRSDPADVALYNALTLGKEVELRVAGKVGGTGVTFATNREGDLDAIVGRKKITVDEVWKLEPEQLS
jgi:hypothetical protein